MAINVPPFRSNPREDATAGTSDRTRPATAPRDDNFRKSMGEGRPKKDAEELAGSTKETKKTSLFDLSHSKTREKEKPSSTTSSKSSFRESSRSSVRDKDSSEFSTHRPVVAKEERDEDQMQDQTSDALTAREEPTHISDETSQSSPSFAEDFYASVNQDQPLTEEEVQQVEAPEPEQPKQPTAPPQPGQMKKTGEPQLQTAQKSKPEKIPPMSPLKHQAALAMQRQHKVKGQGHQESSFETNRLGSTSKKQKVGKGDEGRESATEARGDLASAMHTSVQSVNLYTEKAQETQKTTASSDIQSIVTEIVDRIQVLQKGNETTTMVTLSHPPILKGATISLTTTDPATREFDVKFASLTPEAHAFIERKLDSLTDTLDRKGFNVHITTTTQTENILTVDAGQQTSRDRQEQQEQQQQQQQRRQAFELPDEEGVT